MTAKQWKNKIKKSCVDAGTYKPFFDSVINTLSDILEKRDVANEQFQKTGGKIIVAHTNKAGATNIEQNPCLRAINDLNSSALAYWKELGLTPSSLKKINDKSLLDGSKESLLEKALMKFG